MIPQNIAHQSELTTFNHDAPGDIQVIHIRLVHSGQPTPTEVDMPHICTSQMVLPSDSLRGDK